MHASPRLRRLRNDLAALERLRGESSIFSFKAHGNPPHHYEIAFKGRGLRLHRDRVRPVDFHHVDIKLGASYPRTMPEIHWVTPIFHPNISVAGMVCLGGFSTHWVPSIQLDELCSMLWDMARYYNYDVRSPYNRDSAQWAATQTAVPFPTDSRPLRDLRAVQGRRAPNDPPGAASGLAPWKRGSLRSSASNTIRRLVRRYGAIYQTAGAADVESNQGSRRPLSGSSGEPNGTVGPENGAAGREAADVLYID